MPTAGPSKSIPSHREKQMNPRVQIMPMQVVDKSGATSISTKQKIAERAGVQRVPPAAPTTSAAAGSPGVFPQKSKSLANLSFKKKSSGVVAAVASPLAPAQKPKEGISSYFDGQDVVQSPTSVTGWTGAASPRTGGFPPDVPSLSRYASSFRFRDALFNTFQNCTVYTSCFEQTTAQDDEPVDGPSRTVPE